MWLEAEERSLKKREKGVWNLAEHSCLWGAVASREVLQVGWLQGFKGRGDKCSYLQHLPCCDVSFSHLPALHTVGGIPGGRSKLKGRARTGLNGVCVGRKGPPCIRVH